MNTQPSVCSACLKEYFFFGRAPCWRVRDVGHGAAAARAVPFFDLLRIFAQWINILA